MSNINLNVTNRYNWSSTLFSSLNTNNSTFGGISSTLGDYSLIKSGVYKKLLTAYYQTQDSSDTDTKTTVNKDSETTLSRDEKISESLTSVKTSAKSLKDAASALKKSSLYETTKNEDGEEIDPKDKIKSAVKDFVSAYNSFVENGNQSGVTSIQNKTLNVMKATASNAKLLDSVGITTGNGGKLSLDESKLDSASMSTLKSLFQSSGSYGSTVEYTANESYRVANSNTYNFSNGSSYSYTGSYSMLGTTNRFLDNYL